MNYVWATATHVGLLRDGNEDSMYPEAGGTGPGPFIAAVADGMGGHAAGEVASSIALEASVAASGTPQERVAAANAAVVQAVIDSPDLAGMGTTLTFAEFAEGRVAIGHVGDSRAYLFRDGDLSQVTTDHSLVAELLAAGRIKPEDVRTHPQRNLVTRVIGMTQNVEVDVESRDLVPGDRVLLCSDGLTTMITDEAIATILEEHAAPEECVWALVESANAAGGYDNITVVVVDAGP
jgi:protein phosphatase